ncbi:MAG: leucyl/phenylalanyl-tRNA--protein transferase [Pseudomonadota bacterium]
MAATHPYWIPHDAPPEAFPPVSHALKEPDGLLAVGGDLAPARLIEAYARGIFPWYSDGQPILWWSPDPRAILVPEDLRISRSLSKRARNGGFAITVDRAFADVIAACAGPRRGESGTWITSDMDRAYRELHRLGIAHSIECWHDGQLVGGLYGVKLGGVFFGESMFTRMPDASKVALMALCGAPTAAVIDTLGPVTLIDCQQTSAHLLTLGAKAIPRDAFCELLLDHLNGGERAERRPSRSDTTTRRAQL